MREELAAAAKGAADQEKAGLVRRIDRIDLVCESLVHVILDRGLVCREELGRMMARVDLRPRVTVAKWHADTTARSR